MTRVRVMLVLVVAVLAGCGLAAGTYSYLQNVPVKTVSVPTRNVVVVAVRLQAYENVAIACGVEVMSQVPMGSSLSKGVGKAIPKSYFAQHEWTTQFQAAEAIPAAAANPGGPMGAAMGIGMGAAVGHQVASAMQQPQASAPAAPPPLPDGMKASMNAPVFPL